MKVFVFHTPELTPADTLPDCAVVIDVLRATTTIAAALHAGAVDVRAFSDIDRLMAAGAELAPSQRLRLGERGGKPVEGCDMGNSPLDCTPDAVSGKHLFLSTTNGTRALKRVERSRAVLTAAQINYQAAVNYLRDRQPETVWLVGSGWQGTYSLEDTVCAGAIARALEASAVGNDEVLGAIALYDSWRDRLSELFRHSSHGQRLLRLGNAADIDYCAQSNCCDVLPIQKEPGVLVAL
ncbi:phosphosulfolactate phosphohydrolase [Rubidibacter lacunae KORDI 51-2]|uniref:Probable 2-phosphosulfolactate phosphatase n=1 Tax=Rubidibacter lacunae KORDI 51-2 TaxID=582515 RepID=U5DMY5_9CHRO|nr:2-phosphosulfolactate phosphatase family protein [Rubidibacter lacunae]ERN42207.1 phosphosulfolactate phosphohydrolase [Rubidibacter lacunae KORDI 51-2]